MSSNNENLIVVYIRLISGDQIVAQFMGDDPKDANYIIVRCPMIIENHSLPNTNAMGFSRYLPFDPYQILPLKREHIITITLTTEIFSKYYYNALEYEERFLHPQNEMNLQKINENLQFVLSKSNQEFIETLRKYKDRIPEIPNAIQ